MSSSALILYHFSGILSWPKTSYTFPNAASGKNCNIVIVSSFLLQMFKVILIFPSGLRSWANGATQNQIWR
jgi:hypothetical protein